MLCSFQVSSKVSELYIYIYLFFFRFFTKIGIGSAFLIHGLLENLTHLGLLPWYHAVGCF